MKKHILVVNDEPALRFTNTFLLRKAGYEVSQAKDSEEALARINEAQKKRRSLRPALIGHHDAKDVRGGVAS